MNKLVKGLPACDHCLRDLNLKISQLNLSNYYGYYVANYDFAAKKLLNDIKYQNNYRAALVIGKILGLAAREIPRLQQVDFLLPVPLHHRRLQQRGFNQAEAFCKGFSLIRHRPIYRIIRQRDTEPQNDLTAQERIKNVKNAFRLIEPQKIRAKQILIVDDIYTTGATFYSLANLIRQHCGIPIGLFFSRAK